MESENTRPLGEDLVRAAEHGDTLAFAALVQRFDSLEEAQQLVRAKAFVRMADRTVIPKLMKPEVREASGEPDKGGVSEPTLFGHFAVFNEWTEIDSMFEGHFLERIAPGAFKKTFREQQQKVLFQHGQDPYLGDKILGQPETLAEDEIGAAYEVPLFRGLPELLMDGLRAGAYGSSFRFRMMREEFDQEPDESDHNPRGLPERTLKEVQVPEFGPVSFPAYASATAGVRAIDTSANGNGAEDVAAAPSNGDAAGEEHPQETGRRSETDTSSTERRENVKQSWPRVSQEEWDELWIPEI
jgi:HK97 family phage prohead protease